MTYWKGEICKRCNRRNCIGFHVDDDMWNTVATGYNVLCPTCFDELAEKRGVAYQFLGVWPVSWSAWTKGA